VPDRFAILIDGGFMKRKLQSRLKRFPKVSDIEDEVIRIRAHERLHGLELLRIYFYDAMPATGLLINPIDGTETDLTKTQSYSSNVSLIQSLELFPDMALRLGETMVHGWDLGDAARKNIVEHGPRGLEARDFVPSIEQKGVDLRIGLDIARLSIRQLVQTIVVVTGDSDMVPAFKFARREGVRVALDIMGHAVKRELKVHSDFVI